MSWEARNFSINVFIPFLINVGDRLLSNIKLIKYKIAPLGKYIIWPAKVTSPVTSWLYNQTTAGPVLTQDYDGPYTCGWAAPHQPSRDTEWEREEGKESMRMDARSER